MTCLMRDVAFSRSRPRVGESDTIFTMRCLRYPLLVSACVSLLAVQLGGLHVHVDADGNVGGPRGVHLHAHLLHNHRDEMHVHHPGTPEHGHPGEHEHAGDNEISVTEMRGGKSTLADVDLNLHQVLLIHQLQVAQVRPAQSEPRPVTRKSRWRPPLRAPPPVS